VVTILLVPQSLAYALLAGLPPSVGVMASLLPIVAYAALGSSATLAVGPVAVLAVMTAQAIGPAAAQLGVSPHLAALVLAVEMGAVFLAAALLRLEMLAALLAAPVLHGFMTGAVLLIALGQLPALLGLPLKGNTALELGQAFIKMDHPSAHPATALVGLLSLATLWAIRRYGAPGLSRLGIPRARAQVIARAAPILVVVSAIAWAAKRQA
jgi:SulP family sulfate permease